MASLNVFGFDKERIHVLLFPFPAQGHTIPALMLAERFIEDGNHVSLFTFEDRLVRVHEALEALGMLVEDQQQQQHLEIVTLASGRVPPEAWGKTGHDNPEAVIVMGRQSHESREEFEKVVLEMKKSSAVPLCIVSDNLLGWTQDVANILRVPRYLFYPSPACVLAGVFHTKVLAVEGRLPLKSSDADTLIEIPGIPPIATKDMHSYLLDLVPRIAHDFYAANCIRIHEAAGVFINTSDQLESVALEALRSNKLLNPNMVRIFPVGPLLPRSLLLKEIQSSEERSLLWLNAQAARSVIYVSFGSIIVLSAEQVEEIAYGLKSCEQRFLWSLRAAQEDDGDDDDFPEGFLGAQGLVLRDTWLPQLQILRHEATAAFVTHCGWNSTIESLSSGVPMLVLPSFSDQALNAKMVVDELRVGLRMTIQRGEIERGVKQVMDPANGFAARAQALIVRSC